MPKVRTSRKKPPAGFELIEDTLLDFDRRMRDAEQEEVDQGTARNESLWPIFRLNHQRSRFLYEEFYTKKSISRQLYEWCLKEGYGDASLIAKWKKQGYEKLCCLTCMRTDTQFNTTCICRVPVLDRETKKDIECHTCGCRGCASTD